MKLRSFSRIHQNTVDDEVGKMGNAGKLGLLTNQLGFKPKMPNIVPQADFPTTFKIKSMKPKKHQEQSVMKRHTMDQVKFKEDALDMGGFEKGKLNDFEFRGSKPLVYNPFAGAAGYRSQIGGKNKGGNQNYSGKLPKKEILKPKYTIEKSKKYGTRVVNPERQPAQLLPAATTGTKVGSKSKGLNIRASRVLGSDFKIK